MHRRCLVSCHMRIKYPSIILAIANILYRSFYSLYILPGKHEGFYLIDIYNLHEAIYCFVIGSLLFGYLKMNNKISNLIIKTGIIFCYIITIYMLLSIFSSDIASSIKYFTIPYYSISFVVGLSLSIYFIFYHKAKLLI